MSKKAQVKSKRSAPDAECIKVEIAFPRFREIALYKGDAGYFRTDCSTYTLEGWLKVVEYGIDRFHRDGLLGQDTLKAAGKDPVTEARAHAEHKDKMLRGEAELSERSAGVSPLVDAFRKVMLGVLRKQGLKSKDIGKLGTTVESCIAAGEKALPGLSKHGDALMRKAEAIAAAADLSDIDIAV